MFLTSSSVAAISSRGFLGILLAGVLLVVVFLAVVFLAAGFFSVSVSDFLVVFLVVVFLAAGLSPVSASAFLVVFLVVVFLAAGFLAVSFLGLPAFAASSAALASMAAAIGSFFVLGMKSPRTNGASPFLLITSARKYVDQYRF